MIWSTYARITQNMKAPLLVAVIEPWQEQFKEGRVYYWLTVRVWSIVAGEDMETGV